MGMFDKIKDVAAEQIAKHPDEVEKFSDQAIEKVGDGVDKATGGKFEGQIDKAQETADDKIGE